MVLTSQICSGWCWYYWWHKIERCRGVISNGMRFVEAHHLVEELLGSDTRSYLSESTVVSKGEDDQLILHVPELWQYAVGRSSTGLSCVQFLLQLCRVDIDQLVQGFLGCYHLEVQPAGSLHVHSTLSVTPPGHKSPQYTLGSVIDKLFYSNATFNSCSLIKSDSSLVTVYLLLIFMLTVLFCTTFICHVG